MELVIPRASLGTTKGPFHEGLRFRTLFARNYQRPWEQNSFEGTSTFAVIDTHSEFVMSKTAPALHLLGVGDAIAGKIGLHLAARGQTDAKIAWRYASDAVTRNGTAQVKKGVLAEVVNLPELDHTEAGKPLSHAEFEIGPFPVFHAAPRQLSDSADTAIPTTHFTIQNAKQSSAARFSAHWNPGERDGRVRGTEPKAGRRDDRATEEPGKMANPETRAQHS